MYQAEEYRRAESVEEAAALLRDDGKSAVIAGGMWLRMGSGVYSRLIDLSRLGLDRITETESAVELGAMTTLRQLETSELLRRCFGPVFSECTAPIVGVQFRNSATVGGSVCGKYAFSDVIPVLLSLDAEAVTSAGTYPLEQYLEENHGRELLIFLRVGKDGRRSAYRTQRNSATDFGNLDLCVARLSGGEWRVSVGARPGRAVRCREAEAALAAGDRRAAAEAVAALSYGDTFRASGDYRRALSGVLLRRACAAIEEEEKV